ncbi:MAG: hypothetical protein WB615_02965 [Candidatus Tumulicola sp.]
MREPQAAIVRAFATALLAGVAVACACAHAAAATEFCPATLSGLTPIGAKAPASSYAYELIALTPRSLDASLVADTDSGWYAWSISGVALQENQRKRPLVNGTLRYVVAASASLAVAFPAPVVIRHAWVAEAKTNGEKTMGWDRRGSSACEVPAFSSASTNDPNPASLPAIPTPSPLPSPAIAAARAAPANLPFPVAQCTTPFTQAKAVEIAGLGQIADAPDTFAGSIASAAAYVTIDPNGKLTDAWMFSSSGFAPWDLALLRAARQTTYSGAISYCRRVPATYLFEGDFFDG